MTITLLDTSGMERTYATRPYFHRYSMEVGYIIVTHRLKTVTIKEFRGLENRERLPGEEIPFRMIFLPEELFDKAVSVWCDVKQCDPQYTQAHIGQDFISRYVTLEQKIDHAMVTITGMYVDQEIVKLVVIPEMAVSRVVEMTVDQFADVYQSREAYWEYLQACIDEAMQLAAPYPLHIESISKERPIAHKWKVTCDNGEYMIADVPVELKYRVLQCIDKLKRG